MTFPTFKNTPQFQNRNSNNYYSTSGEVNQTFTQSTSTTATMSYKGTLRKGLLSFAVLLGAAALGWFVPILALPAILVALVVGLIVAFKRISNPLGTLSYTILQGVAVGGISGILEQIYPGVVSQAVLATLCVFSVILFFFSRGVFRTTPLLNKIFIVSSVSYLLFGLVNLVLMLTGVTQGMFGVYGDLGGWSIAIGVLGTLLASYSLVMDFEYVKNGVNNQIDSKWEWLAVFSLIGTLVWLYLEILRLLSLFRQ